MQSALNPYVSAAHLQMLAGLDEPYRSQCAAALVAHPALPERALRELREFDDPYRSQCLAALMAQPDLDLAKLRVVYAFADPFRTLCLGLLAASYPVDGNRLVDLQALPEPFRTRALAALVADPAVDTRAIQAMGDLPEPFRTLTLSLAVTRGRIDAEPAMRGMPVPGVPAAVLAPPPAPPPEIDAARVAEFGHYRPEVPGHADVFFRDVFGVSDPAYDDERHLTETLEWLLRSRDATGTAGFAASGSATTMPCMPNSDLPAISACRCSKPTAARVAWVSQKVSRRAGSVTNRSTMAMVQAIVSNTISG